jgi:hypothetical protein
MEHLKLLDMVIEQTKQLAKPGDRAMTYIPSKDGDKLVIGMIALDEKYQTCLALEALKVASGCEEIVLVQEGWLSKQEKGKEQKCAPSEDPNRVDCFVINYFSKDKCIAHILEFEPISGPRKLKWTNETSYLERKDEDKCESKFNPFRFTEEDIKCWMQLMEQEGLRKTGKKEVLKLAHDFHVDIYRKGSKVFLEAFNEQGEIFFSTPVMEDDSQFEKKIKKIKDILDMIGGLK